MVAEESIMIAIDNSGDMRVLGSYRYKLQIRCIRSYCRAKLKSNPKNAIGLVSMGNAAKIPGYPDKLLYPTSDLNEILSCLHYKEPMLLGDLDFSRGFRSCFSILLDNELSKLKRMLFFIGGPTNLSIRNAKSAGMHLKKFGIAIDVLYFRLPKCYDEFKTFKTLVDAANDDGNCHIAHYEAKPDTHLSQILTSHPEIFSSDLPEGEEIARNKKAKYPKGKNQSAAEHDEYVKADNDEADKKQHSSTSKDKSNKRKRSTSKDKSNKRKRRSKSESDSGSDSESESESESRSGSYF